MIHKKHLLIICSFFVIFACKNELKITFTDTNITTSNNKLVEVSIPNAIGNNLVSNKINSEINNIVIAALQIGEAETITSKTIEESITLFNGEYDAFNTDFPDSTQPWEAQIDGEVMFQSPEIISISITSYVNTGGANGLLNISFLNFDAVTGKRIQNNDLFKNEDAFKTMAKFYFETAIKDEDIVFEPANFQLSANIGYNEDGIILLYNTNEIAPYSTGIIDFTVPFEKASSFLVFNGS